MNINKHYFEDGHVLTAEAMNAIEDNIEYSAQNSIVYDYINDAVLFYSGDVLVGSLPISLVNKVSSMKVLFVGNSFSANTSTYMYDFLTSIGVSDVDISYLYIGSCTIDKHWTNASNDKEAYKYFKWNSQSTNFTPTEISTPGTYDYKISTAVQEQDWDWIIFSQGSGSSGVESAYSNLRNLVNYVKGLVTSENTKYAFNMTWAYQSDSTHSSFPTYNNDQTYMYEQIVLCAKNEVLTLSDIDVLIPCGTAIQNCRTSYKGDRLTADGYHLNADGCFLASLTTCFSLLAYMNKMYDIRTYDIDHFLPGEKYVIKATTSLTYGTLEISTGDAYYEAVKNAIVTPLEITQSVLNV